MSNVVFTDIQNIPGGAFASYTQAQIETAIARAERRINAAFWGNLEDDGVFYLTAHIMAVEDPTNAASGGSIRRQQAGPLEKEFQHISWSADWYNATSYGREYKALLSTLRYKATPRAI